MTYQEQIQLAIWMRHNDHGMYAACEAALSYAKNDKSLAIEYMTEYIKKNCFGRGHIYRSMMEKVLEYLG